LRTPTFHLAEGINSDVQSVNIGIIKPGEKPVTVHAPEERKEKSSG